MSNIQLFNMPKLLEALETDSESDGPPSLWDDECESQPADAEPSAVAELAEPTEEAELKLCSSMRSLKSAVSTAVSNVQQDVEGTVTTCTLVRQAEDEKLGAWIRGNALTNIARGSPAERAGLTVGMKILEVDGQPVDSAATSGLVSRLWKENSQVTLRVESVAMRSKRSLAKARARQRQRAHSGVSNVSGITTSSCVSATSSLAPLMSGDLTLCSLPPPPGSQPCTPLSATLLTFAQSSFGSPVVQLPQTPLNYTTVAAQQALQSTMVAFQ